MRVCVLSTYHYHIIIHSLLSAVVRHQYSRDRTSTPVGRKSKPGTLAGSPSACVSWTPNPPQDVVPRARDRGHDDELAAFHRVGKKGGTWAGDAGRISSAREAR